MAPRRAIELAKEIWEYMKLHEPLKKCDVILALGSHDENVAIRASKLYFDGYADKIIFSGGFGKFTSSLFPISEAEMFKNIAVELGVPEEDILLETESTNLGDNFQLTDDLIHKENLKVKTILVVTKPAAERRVRSTFDKQMPFYKGIITSPTMSFDEYLLYYYTIDFPIDELICALVGDLQRLMVYYYYGFTSFVNVPIKYIKVFNELVEMGYDKYLV